MLSIEKDQRIEENTLHIRWLGSVSFQETLALQQQIFKGKKNYLLLVEHPSTYTMGVRTKREHLLVDPDSLGISCIPTNRGGDITYHGPGQIVGYPLLSVKTKRGGGMADTAVYVRTLEMFIITVLQELGLANVGTIPRCPGVWVDPDGTKPRKIAALGVRLDRGRSMHGFALNVDPDMHFFEHIVPCGITDKGVTSLKLEGIVVSNQHVVNAMIKHANILSADDIDMHGVVWKKSPSDLSLFSRGAGPGEKVVPKQISDEKNKAIGVTSEDVTTTRVSPIQIQQKRSGNRLDEAGVGQGVALSARKPTWLRAPVRIDSGYLQLKKTVKDFKLVTVCEEAGCPNIYDCWADGTATFMINGERCTRACGFCLVDTRKPEPLDSDEPMRIAQAIKQMNVSFAVLTTVARDDLDDGGSSAFAETIQQIRIIQPETKIEVLISDCKGDEKSLQTIFSANPDVLNHNIETVARLQRAVRPSAGYARSLAVLARAKEHGLITKSGLMVGLGEHEDEIIATLHDLHAVGVDIVTIGQYLRPTTHHLDVQKWWTPDEFIWMKQQGEKIGIKHVESSPLTRSSYHAASAANVAMS